MVKVRQESEQTTLQKKLQQRKLSKRTLPVLFDMFLNVQNSKLQPDASSETSMFTNSQLNLLMKKKNSATVAIHIPANDERKLKLQKIQSDAKTRFRVRPPSSLAMKCVLGEGENWDQHLESSRQNREIPSIGPCGVK